MDKDPESNDYRPNDRPEGRGHHPSPCRSRLPRLPAAAGHMRRASGVYLLTILSAVDGTLVMLGASGRLSTLGGALVVGLTVIAGAGSWVAAREAFAGPRVRGADAALLGGLGFLTMAATMAAVWLGATLGQAATLHVMPKAAGLVLVALGAEIAGLRLPRLAKVPVPLAIVGGAAVLEALLQWIP